MRVLIFGGTGMLGHKLVGALGRQFEAWSTIRGPFSEVEYLGIFDRSRTIENVEAVDADSLACSIEKSQPDVVINAIGVIKQLPSSKDVIHTLTINSILPHRLAELSEKYGFRLICISTDCVFDGEKGMYTEEDAANALDLYGRSKNLGEVVSGNALTIRTSIIGREIGTAHSLVEWFIGNQGKTVKGFANAIYSGFPTIVFADIIADLIVNHSGLSGLYHISSEPISKFELLQLVKSSYGLDIEIERFEDFRIDRSLDSTKFRNVTGFRPMDWKTMVEQMAADSTPYDKWRK